MKDEHKDFDVMMNEMKRDHPVEYEIAKKVVKQYIADIKSGKAKMTITDFTIDPS